MPIYIILQINRIAYRPSFVSPNKLDRYFERVGYVVSCFLNCKFFVVETTLQVVLCACNENMTDIND